jgi:hypothetical protein
MAISRKNDMFLIPLFKKFFQCAHQGASQMLHAPDGVGIEGFTSEIPNEQECSHTAIGFIQQGELHSE